MKTKEELEAEAQAEAEKEFEASLEGLSEEEKNEKLAERQKALSQNNTNEALKQELEAEKQKRIEAEDKIEETRRKARERWEQKKREAEERGETIEDEPLTRQSLQDVLAEERELIRKEARSERANEIAHKLAENPHEAELILEVWKNRTLSGSLEEQISEAHAIATYKKTTKMNNELKRALNSKEGVSDDNLNSQRKPLEGGEPKINPVDKSVLAGYVWDNAKKAYKKLIAGGTKFMFVSADMKKRWVENAK